MMFISMYCDQKGVFLRWEMPDQYLTEWYRNLSGAVKTAFYAAFAAGLAAHLYQFTNKLYNYDELANTPGSE